MISNSDTVKITERKTIQEKESKVEAWYIKIHSTKPMPMTTPMTMTKSDQKRDRDLDRDRGPMWQVKKMLLRQVLT